MLRSRMLAVSGSALLLAGLAACGGSTSTGSTTSAVATKAPSASATTDACAIASLPLTTAGKFTTPNHYA